MKGLKKHILDFEIVPTGNPKTLVFIDSSDYYIEPEKPLLEITLPGYNKYFLVNVVARKVNTFNSNTIGLTDLINDNCLIDLPDGSYHLRYKICPYNLLYIDKKFFRTTMLEQKLIDLYDKIDGTDCSTKEDKVKSQDLIEIHTLIEGAKSIVNKNEKKANSFYQIASKLVDKLSDSVCNKNCR
jgi:hypothetical protein